MGKALEVYGIVENCLHHSHAWHQLEVNAPLRATVALFPSKEPLIYFGWEQGDLQKS
jgi:hypothetical protein